MSIMLSPCNSIVLEDKEAFRKSSETEYASEHKNYKLLFWEFKTPLKWTHVIDMTLFHILTVYVIATLPYFEKPGIIIYGK